MDHTKIIFLNTQDKLELLKSLNNDSVFYNLSFFNSLRILSDFKDNYFFYLKNNYNISIDLAIKIKKFFDYLDLDKLYVSEKLNQLKIIKKSLIKNNIMIPFDYKKYHNSEIIAYYNMPVPKLFKPKEVQAYFPISNTNTDISLYKTSNIKMSCLAVYQEIIKLLEKGIDINKINVLNTTDEDDYHLNKLLKDANIPLNINKKISINKYPLIVEIIEVIKHDGYFASKEYLKDLIKKNHDHDLLNTIQNIYNKFLDKDLENYPDLLINQINSASVKQKKYSNSINIYEFTDYIYKPDNYYLVMNYNDSSFPRKVIFTGYLDFDELREIGYISENKYNEYLKEYYTASLKEIKNLVLFFSEKTIKDNRLADLNLERKMIEIDYQYKINGFTYLDSLNQLEFAKTKYDYINYYLKDYNYNQLFNTYDKSIKEYTHDFTGIYDKDKEKLLKKNNSITGAKVESYNKCKFQFLLKYLLKLEAFEANMNLYLGNLTHKVLEEYVLNHTLDVNHFIDQYPDFPIEEIYKEKVFKKAMKKEIASLLEVIKEFHDMTLFKDIKPELKFEFPLKHDQNFVIRGTIDKVMSYSDNKGINYVALIDYKLGGSNDFDREKFNKKLQFQLPVYLYAYKKIGKSLATPIGFYYQKTSLGRYTKGNNAVIKNYQLKGLSLEDKTLLENFNPSLELLRGVSVKNNGEFSKTSSSRIASKKEFKVILDQVEKGFVDMVDSLKTGDFSIDPLNAYGLKQDSVSCQYCKFNNICYSKNKNLGVSE
ncbi:PD-(D/E)XK nuclease family protein [Candidatus Izemoplasma sp. B36]|uniref:PD-(D/E)XK nuclease family protein n=1 Tax=Candidatus Izemoplasma sp. B36 TaxID=3242468 RepID=UPI00355638F1